MEEAEQLEASKAKINQRESTSFSEQMREAVSEPNPFKEDAEIPSPTPKSRRARGDRKKSSMADSELQSIIVSVSKQQSDVPVAVVDLNPKPSEKKKKRKAPLPHHLNVPYLFMKAKGPSDPVVGQGELLRFRPGIEKDFIPRWVQLTRKSLRYFENRLRAESCLQAEQLLRQADETGVYFGPSAPVSCTLNAPLISIPVEVIKRARRRKAAEFQIQQNRNREKQKPLYANMFEVELKCDYDKIHQFRQAQKAEALE